MVMDRLAGPAMDLGGGSSLQPNQSRGGGGGGLGSNELQRTDQIIGVPSSSFLPLPSSREKRERERLREEKRGIQILQICRRHDDDGSPERRRRPEQQTRRPRLGCLLAFLQAFAAVSALLYAAWILSRWARHHQLRLQDLLPGLWFPSLLMAAGLVYCLLLLAGYLAAEINNGCCLCFVRPLFFFVRYTIPAMAMMLLEAALAGHVTINDHWMQDLPDDRTGELHNLLSFIHDNLDLCKWAALAIFATQALSLLLAMILRALLSARTMDYDSDEDFVAPPPPYLPTTADTRGFRPDLWSSRMRHKVTIPLLCAEVEPSCPLLCPLQFLMSLHLPEPSSPSSTLLLY
ncbi:hypothetical protein HU200_039678 [Digitaria exilis]|uniref:Tetraspanin-18 n=1 Tax=Digitaria exilis TaxID=1010633 RepID=A0A835BLV7_9POAL|nr:hypothetical protein HU200_039678 [Digitaria exilis]